MHPGLVTCHSRWMGDVRGGNTRGVRSAVARPARCRTCPDDRQTLATVSVSPAAAAHRPRRRPGPLGAEGYSGFQGTWERHTSELGINPDKTGSVSYGSGCCNAIKVPVTYEMDGNGKTLIGSVSGNAVYTGDSFRYTELPVGNTFRFHIEESEPSGGRPTGPVVVQDKSLQFIGSGAGRRCSTAYDISCGAWQRV